MEHIYNEGRKDHPTFVLLHGTGGSENDLLPLAEAIDQYASVLSLRGDVNENGMNRFFKRLKPGVFDEADLKKRTTELSHYIKVMAKKYKFDINNVIAIGYSNGANIAASVLMTDNTVFKGAILHHPMVPLRDVNTVELDKVKILITAGENDPICPKEESDELFTIFKSQGADVSIEWFNQGHTLSMEEVSKASTWYNKYFL